MNLQPGPSGGDHGLAARLLPVVRRTLQVGDGPRWVVAVVRSLSGELAPRSGWTRADERLARRLAAQAARLLAPAGADRGGAETVRGP